MEDPEQDQESHQGRAGLGLFKGGQSLPHARSRPVTGRLTADDRIPKGWEAITDRRRKPELLGISGIGEIGRFSRTDIHRGTGASRRHTGAGLPRLRVRKAQAKG